MACDGRKKTAGAAVSALLVRACIPGAAIEQHSRIVRPGWPQRQQGGGGEW